MLNYIGKGTVLYYYQDSFNRLKNYLNKEFKFFVSLPALIWQILFLLIPLVIILISSFYCQNCPYVNLDLFFSVVNFAHLKIIFRTLIVAFINSFICLVIGYPVAYYIAFNAKKSKNFLIAVLMLPLWIAFLVQVYAWFFILEQNGIINKILLSLGIISNPLHLMNNIAGIIIVMVYIYLPFMIMPLYNALEKFDYQLIEASLNLSASKWQTFKKVTFPLSLSGVYLGFFLVFSMSFGEVAIPMLLGGNKSLFVGVLISQYFIGLRNTSKGAAFTMLSALILTLFMLILYLIFRKKLRLTK